MTQFFAMLFLKILSFKEVEHCRDDERLSFKEYQSLCSNHWNEMRNDTDDEYVPVQQLPVFP